MNAGVGHYMENCEEGKDVLDCMVAIAQEDKAEGAVAATGVYTYQDYSATFTLNIPLEGGTVTGKTAGTCNRVAKGTSGRQG